MNKKRLELDKILCGIINITEPDGDTHVYFDPPMDIKMKYDAYRTPYEVIVIYKNPDSDYVSKLLSLPYCSHDRHYTANNLYHDVFTIYY